jgi:hypothetical protein
MKGVRAGTALVVCDQWLGSNGYAGMKALRRTGWMVSVVPEWEYVPLKWQALPARVIARALRFCAVREFNRALVREVQTIRPDFLLVFKGRFVSADALRAVRSTGTLAYCFFPDNSFRAHGNYLSAALREYDWIYTSKSFGLRDMKEQLGVVNASLLLHGYDRDLHRRLALTAEDMAEFGADASFIGNWSPKKELYLARLTEAFPSLKLKIWGPAWANARSPALHEMVKASRPIVGEEYVRAIHASKINIAILSERRTGSSADDQITSRTFHIPACGGFMLHERTPEVTATLKEGIEVACFRDVSELISSVTYWIDRSEQRQTLAAAGHSAVAAAHSWDHRIAVILREHALRRAAAFAATSSSDARPRFAYAE